MRQSFDGGTFYIKATLSKIAQSRLSHIGQKMIENLKLCMPEEVRSRNPKRGEEGSVGELKRTPDEREKKPCWNVKNPPPGDNMPGELRW